MISTQTDKKVLTRTALKDAMQEACGRIAPLWPLENFVAVNPYLGLSEKTFANAATELAVLGDISSTLPLAFYLHKLDAGLLSREDIAAAMATYAGDLDTVGEFIAQVRADAGTEAPDSPVSTLAEVAGELSRTDWRRFMTERVASWAAAYFDQGQAVWQSAPQADSLFQSWKTEAGIDRSPALQGLKGFRKHIRALSTKPEDAAMQALEILGIPEAAMPHYFHRLLLHVGGWAAHVARLDWDAGLYGREKGRLQEFLSILLCWETCLLQCLDEPLLRQRWEQALTVLSLRPHQEMDNSQLRRQLIMQDAWDRAAQRRLISSFAGTERPKAARTQPDVQAAFCIDVRSEVFRRHLEQCSEHIQTIGFAGFFGFPIRYVPLGHEEGEAQCPVLLPTGPVITEKLPETAEDRRALKGRRLSQQFSQLWHSFKSGAVTCFSFVSPLGLSYLPKLFTDSFGLTRPVPHPDKAGLSAAQYKRRTVGVGTSNEDSPAWGIPLSQQIQMAKNALRGMSLTSDFARLVLLVGHGSSTVNNPHATGLDCGACGGHTGEANAKVAAAVLNNPAVRKGLMAEGIDIPATTIFLACLHDTTTDEVTIYQEEEVPATHKEDLLSLKSNLKLAGEASRAERALRMALEHSPDPDAAVLARSKDWSQVRPEWGLAGCSAFVVAPRERTMGLNLGGKAFLHNYDWHKDADFSILELIMTAPMVVTSWINLQYYASTVDNQHFGSGNKTLHNVTSGLGVLEGYGGDLRVGLPVQSVHDGEQFQHEPLRLQVVIEAPTDAMSAILARHEGVRNLCDNQWLFLLAMDEKGKITHRYAGDLQWEAVQ